MSKATETIRNMIGSRHDRLLNLYFPDNDGPDAGLLINRLVMDEYVSRDFRAEVTAFSDDANIDPVAVQGRMVAVELLRDDGSSRWFHGQCHEFVRESVDGGLAVYTLILRPWLALFRLKRNYRLFHRQNISDQTKAIFGETGLASHMFDLHDPDAVRTFSCQYDETDYNYLHRRWEEMGWHYRYEHQRKGHKLILCDQSAGAPPIDGVVDVAWHVMGGSNLHDKFDNWSPQVELVSGKVALAGFDFKKPVPQKVLHKGELKQGVMHQLEVFDYAGLYGFRDAADGERMARLRMEACEAGARSFRARGNCRSLQPGRWFRLRQDFAGQALQDDGGDEFFVLSVRHVADNNYLNAGGSEASYCNESICVPRSQVWRPAQGFNSQETRVIGVDTATVTGSGDDIYTDEYGRIRVQFHWDREGGNDAGSSAWIRVASNWAGGELGTIALPRVGQEVLVQWLSGSPDRPIVTGCVANERNMPPWELPSQQALSGWRSRELKAGSGNAAGGRSNQLVFDDTDQKIQVQLRSDHTNAQLSLGSITRIDSTAGRKDARGEGFELATDAWGVLRAGKGMLLSTYARPNARGHAKAMPETITRLQKAHKLHESNAKTAEKHKAQEGGQQASVAQKLEKQAEAVKGKDQGEGVFPELTEPHMVLASPAGIIATADKTQHWSAGEHVALTAGKHIALAAGGGFFASVAQTIRLFAHRLGMKLIAADGDIDIVALSASINVLAKLEITHTAERITITGTNEVVINGGGSYLKFSAGGIEQGTSGNHVSHAATHDFTGGKTVPAEMPPLPPFQESA